MLKLLNRLYLRNKKTMTHPRPWLYDVSFAGWLFSSTRMPKSFLSTCLSPFCQKISHIIFFLPLKTLYFKILSQDFLSYYILGYVT